MNIRVNLLAASLALALSTAGCASMKGLLTRASPNNAGGLAANKSLGRAQLSPADWPHNDWWKRFDDAQLNQLMDEALSGSPSLRVAQARVQQAAAAADVARANLYPQVTGSLGVSRQRLSENGLIPRGLFGPWVWQNQVQASLSHEIDFWGKNRAAYGSALDQSHAQEVDAFAARLVLSVGVAQGYVQLARAYDQLDIAETTLAQRQSIYQLTRERVDAGLDSQLELKQTESAVPAAREQIAQINESIELARNQLAALLGQGPDRGLAVLRPQLRANGGVSLPANLPADLIGRRPDVVAQRWRVEAANKDINVAKAQFYPNISLTAFLGLQSITLGSFFKSGSTIAGVGPAVSLPIFDGGRLRGNLASKNAAYDILVEQYNQTLVDALRDIVDQLASIRSVAEQRSHLASGLATAQQAYDLALLRYREGVGNYLEVLAAETQVLAQKSLQADLHAREFELSINLIRALGGGFEQADAAPSLGAR